MEKCKEYNGKVYDGDIYNDGDDDHILDHGYHVKDRSLTGNVVG